MKSSPLMSVVLLSVMTNYGGAGSSFDDMCKHAGVTNAVAAVGLRNGQPLTPPPLSGYCSTRSC